MSTSSPNAVRYGDQTLIYEETPSGWSAVVFGSGDPVTMTPELIEIIDADHAHQLRKRGLVRSEQDAA